MKRKKQIQNVAMNLRKKKKRKRQKINQKNKPVIKKLQMRKNVMKKLNDKKMLRN